MEKLYNQFKECASCGFEDKREIGLEIAAFEETRIWNNPCPKCGCLEIRSSAMHIPEPNRELMAIWSTDLNLSFYEQDEDICLASEENFKLLLEFLDASSTLLPKKSILLAALCILIYDNIPDDHHHAMNSEIANIASFELKKRIGLFVELDTDMIMEYIKKVVYPKIGLPLAVM